MVNRLMGTRRRPTKSLNDEAVKLCFRAMKEINTALEWLDRDADGGFLETALDNAHICWRFLGQFLAKHGRIPTPKELKDDD